MDLYILGSNFKRSQLIEGYESLIWTERFNTLGDFELMLPSTTTNRSLLILGAMLAIDETIRVMRIETVEDIYDEEGRSMLKVSGRSLESILEGRYCRNSWNSIGAVPTWKLTGTPAGIARAMFKAICVDGVLSPADTIPMFDSGSLFPTGTVPEPTETITVDLPIQTLWKALSELCGVYSLGIRMYRGRDTGKVFFNIYAGSDRTSTQSINPPVVFSSDFDNLKSVTTLNSIQNYYNIAYVWSKNGSRSVPAPGIDNSSTRGFDRFVLPVDASDIETAGGTALQLELLGRGTQALAEHRSTQAMDGEIPKGSGYQYGTDYHLGDIVEMRDKDGLVNRMRVTEQIFTSDSTGIRSYPTLITDTFVTPGSWFAWDGGMVWDSAVGTWNSL